MPDGNLAHPRGSILGSILVPSCSLPGPKPPVFYNEFQSVISQIPTALQLIPAVFEESDDAAGDFYEYEPDENEILTELLPRAMTWYELESSTFSKNCDLSQNES